MTFPISYILTVRAAKTHVSYIYFYRCSMYLRSCCTQCEWCLHSWYLSTRPTHATVMAPVYYSMKIPTAIS